MRKGEKAYSCDNLIRASTSPAVAAKTIVQFSSRNAAGGYRCTFGRSASSQALLVREMVRDCSVWCCGTAPLVARFLSAAFWPALPGGRQSPIDPRQTNVTASRTSYRAATFLSSNTRPPRFAYFPVEYTPRQVAFMSNSR